jgi:hypothetical protein
MDLSRGFEIEDPAVVVPWGVSETELLDILPVVPQHVTSGYYVIDCVSLGGLRHALGFHFRPRRDGKLVELEFFRRSYPGYPDLRESFLDFQARLESTFGRPTTASPGDEGVPNYTWRVGHATIRHYVFDRFGPEEHVRIVRS